MNSRRPLIENWCEPSLPFQPLDSHRKAGTLCHSIRLRFRSQDDWFISLQQSSHQVSRDWKKTLICTRYVSEEYPGSKNTPEEFLMFNTIWRFIHTLASLFDELMFHIKTQTQGAIRCDAYLCRHWRKKIPCALGCSRTSSRRAAVQCSEWSLCPRSSVDLRLVPDASPPGNRKTSYKWENFPYVTQRRSKKEQTKQHCVWTPSIRC